ncbi:uncharacterized protein N7484_000067 [Penicillium longicatenatum]|uniref:uncharacterized protein n=1 Tax=Penicillium longicatenatum TaxID=1561947 RepID=UPI0025480BE5|nr:uncharacterized protein N7484_000067 [Penicillium longicatenatum]KAJ5660695.1 hypothetical protein N7484_000067 [Penicillium longicatenatum]
MAQDQLAIVICHGSYHSTAPYEPFLQALNSRGYETYCPQRPTADLSRHNVGDLNNPDFDRGPGPEGLASDFEDVVVLNEILEKLIQQEGKQVLLVGHSSGGWMATQAAIPKLQYKTRQENGQPGGLIGLFYYAAFAIPVNESISGFFQPKDGSFYMPPWLRFYKHGAAGVGTLVEPEKYLFNGLDAESAAKWSATLTASPINTGVLTNDPYSTLPCAYLVCDDDLILPKMGQEAMIGLQSANGNTFTVYHAAAGHSAHLTCTQELVERVTEFANQIKTSSAHVQI